MQGTRKALFIITLASHDYLFVGKGIVQVDIWRTSTSPSESAPETLTIAIVKARKSRRSRQNGVGIGGARVFAGHVDVARFCAAQYIQVGGRQSHEMYPAFVPNNKAAWIAAPCTSYLCHGF